jgi:cell fate (sporulation/competence/biofilm development) regulator YlbF (YheA/YmcA/DUF963 family)
MEVTAEENIVGARTRELCEALAVSPEFQSIRLRIERFSGDVEARMQFEIVSRRGAQLQQRQEAGEMIGEMEVAEFERQREALVSNDVAREFLEAREDMIRLQEEIASWVGKTFELGRAPTASDMEGSCGPGCGCA